MTRGRALVDDTADVPGGCKRRANGSTLVVRETKGDNRPTTVSDLGRTASTGPTQRLSRARDAERKTGGDRVNPHSTPFVTFAVGV